MGHTCGEYGHVTKTGAPCGFHVSGLATVCQHHDVDKTRQQRITTAGGKASHRMTKPVRMRAKIRTVEDLQHSYAEVIRQTCAKDTPDLKRLELILKALSGANAVLQTATIKELNDTVLRAEGHGPALVILEGLKAGRMRRLPVSKAKDIQDAEVG